MAVHWLAVSSVCFNPFVYCWLNASFRETLRVACRQCYFAFSRPRLNRRRRQNSPVSDHGIISPADAGAAALAVRYDRLGNLAMSFISHAYGCMGG